MKYTLEMASSNIIYVLSFIQIGSGDRSLNSKQQAHTKVVEKEE
jgi:hypothetical protein